jgi:hypothetical protein
MKLYVGLRISTELEKGSHVVIHEKARSCTPKHMMEKVHIVEEVRGYLVYLEGSFRPIPIEYINIPRNYKKIL